MADGVYNTSIHINKGGSFLECWRNPGWCHIIANI